MAARGRKVEQMTESEFVRSRYQIWFGSDSPKTISAKEICDNGIDQVADGLASKVVIKIKPNTIIVADNGHGISMDVDQETGKTHLFLAVGKLYTSSNYGGTENLTGTNGVGATGTNFLSKDFKSGYVTGSRFKGYFFNEGKHESDGDVFDEVENFESGLDLCDKFSSYHYVYADFNESILSDEINHRWLLSYLEDRAGEMPENGIVCVEVEQKDGSVQKYEYNKIKGSQNYVKSWEEKVTSIQDSVIVDIRGGWRFAYSKTQNAFDNIRHIVSGAPVNNSSTFSASFDIEDLTVSISVPVSYHYAGKLVPKYTDQTKRRITISSSDLLSPLKAKCPEIYNYFNNKAKEAYLARLLKKNDNGSFWPAIGPIEKQELIIAEGYSAISGIKNSRNPETQACMALRGKILNVIQKDLKSAMKSPVVKDLLAVLTKFKFNRVIIAVDADPDGSHIGTLLIGLIYKFCPHYIEEGRLFYCNTPLYVFTKNKDIKWSDKSSDCPQGYKLTVKKGLGSLTPTEIELFITNEETRDIWMIEEDRNANSSLWQALAEGCKNWIHEHEV